MVELQALLGWEASVGKMASPRPSQVPCWPGLALEHQGREELSYSPWTTSHPGHQDWCSQRPNRRKRQAGNGPINPPE